MTNADKTGCSFTGVEEARISQGRHCTGIKEQTCRVSGGNTHSSDPL